MSVTHRAEPKGIYIIGVEDQPTSSSRVMGRGVILGIHSRPGVFIPFFFQISIDTYCPKTIHLIGIAY